MITSVARDDVDDGGAGGFAATIRGRTRAHAEHHDRGAHPGLQGRPDVARRDLRGAPRRAQPQPGDGGAPPTRGATVGRVLPLARAARAREGRRACAPSRGSSSGWARPRPSCAARSPTCATSVSTSSRSASISGRRRRHLPGRPLVDPRRVRRARRLRREPRLRPRGVRPARPLQLPRQARRRPTIATGVNKPGHTRSADAGSLSGGGVRVNRARDVGSARARARMRELGVDVLLLSTGADLPYLTGYEAMPLERLTMLVLPADGDAVLVVPRLEAPRVVERPDAFSIRPWEETEDPIAVVAGLVGAASTRRDRRSDLGALRDRAPGRAAAHALPPRRRRHRAAPHRQGRGRGRRAARRGGRGRRDRRSHARRTLLGSPGGRRAPRARRAHARRRSRARQLRHRRRPGPTRRARTTIRPTA